MGELTTTVGRYALRARLCKVVWPGDALEEGGPLPSPPAWADPNAAVPPAPASTPTPVATTTSRRRKKCRAIPSELPEGGAPKADSTPAPKGISLPAVSSCFVRLSAAELFGTLCFDFKALHRYQTSNRPLRKAKEALFELSPRDAMRVLPVALKISLYGEGALLGATCIVAGISSGYVRREALIADSASRTICRASLDVWMELREEISVPCSPVSPAGGVASAHSPSPQASSPHSPAGVAGGGAPTPRYLLPPEVPDDVPAPEMPVPTDPLGALGVVLSALHHTVAHLSEEGQIQPTQQTQQQQHHNITTSTTHPLRYIVGRLRYAEELFLLARHAHLGEGKEEPCGEGPAGQSGRDGGDAQLREEADLIKRLWDAERGALQDRSRQLDVAEASLLARERAVAKREEILRRRVPASIYGASVLDQHIGHVNSLQTWQSLCQQNAALTQSLLRHIPPKQSIIEPHASQRRGREDPPEQQGSAKAAPEAQPSQDEVNKIVASGLAALAQSYDKLRDVSDTEVRLGRDRGELAEREGGERALHAQEEQRCRKVLLERLRSGAEAMQEAAAAAVSAAAPAAQRSTPPSGAAPAAPATPPSLLSARGGGSGEAGGPTYLSGAAPPPPEPATSPLLPTNVAEEEEEGGPVGLKGADDSAPLTSPCITPLKGGGTDRSQASLRSTSTASGYVGLLSQALRDADVRGSRESRSPLKSPHRNLHMLHKVLANDPAVAALRASLDPDDVRQGDIAISIASPRQSDPANSPSYPEGGPRPSSSAGGDGGRGGASSASGAPGAAPLMSPSSQPVPATHDLAFDIPEDEEDKFSIDTQ